MVAYSFKRQFVPAIRLGLGLDPIGLEPGARRPKRQTIRGPRRRHARPGEETQLYTAMRTKQCEIIGKALCNRFEGVLLKWSEWQSFHLFDVAEREPGVWRRVGDLRPIADVEAFALSDGFASFEDMADFWREQHGAATFEGFLIGWEPLSPIARYPMGAPS